MLAAMDNFNNADKNSFSWKMHAPDTVLALRHVQPDNHTQKPPKRLSWSNQCSKSQPTALSGDLFLLFYSKASTQLLISNIKWVLLGPNI